MQRYKVFFLFCHCSILKSTYYCCFSMVLKFRMYYENGAHLVVLDFSVIFLSTIQILLTTTPLIRSHAQLSKLVLVGVEIR